MSEDQVEVSAEEAVVDTPAEVSTETSDELLAGKYKSAEDLVSAYKTLESKIGEKEESIRDKLREEMSQPKEGVPDSSGEYELPDFIDTEEAVNSDSLRSWAEYCHEKGYDHSEFQKGIELYMDAMPEGPDLESEAAQLGENSSSRIEAASLFASKFFPEDAMPAIERMCEGADGIIALEAIMQQLKDPSIINDTQTASSVNEASLNEMMKDERYWNPRVRDDHYVKQVQDGFKKLYG
jgi:hypothetical protein